MRALVYTGPSAIELRDEPEPAPCSDEVLVRVEAVGICGSDMHAYHGHDSLVHRPSCSDTRRLAASCQGRMRGAGLRSTRS
jgi:threonine dehydrogenase-like Zn-dependent dehydrogenase